MRQEHRFEEWRGMRGFSREGFGPGAGHEHGGRWGRHGFGGRGGSGRPFDHGELRLVVLALLAEKPSHGYELIKAIEDRFGGSYSPSPGVVYPTLTMLEELGHATVEETGGKKRYTITELGREYLAANREATDRAMGRMGDAGERPGMGQMFQLMRAMSNFKMAIKMRQRSGPISDEQLKTIIAAIDAAAVAIERS